MPSLISCGNFPWKHGYIMTKRDYKDRWLLKLISNLNIFWGGRLYYEEGWVIFGFFWKNWKWWIFLFVRETACNHSEKNQNLNWFFSQKIFGVWGVFIWGKKESKKGTIFIMWHFFGREVYIRYTRHLYVISASSFLYNFLNLFGKSKVRHSFQKTFFSFIQAPRQTMGTLLPLF